MENGVKIIKQLTYIILGSGVTLLLLIIKTYIFPEYSTADYETAVIALRTIVCDNCIGTIKKALSKNPGVISSDVNIVTKTASIRYDITKTSVEDIENNIINSGYDANNKAADSTAYRNLSSCCQIWGNGDDYMKLREQKHQGCKGGCCSN